MMKFTAGQQLPVTTNPLIHCMMFTAGQITVDEFNQKYMAARKVRQSVVTRLLFNYCLLLAAEYFVAASCLLCISFFCIFAYLHDGNSSGH